MTAKSATFAFCQARETHQPIFRTWTPSIPSAINTWIGEEFRTIGGEVSTTLMGAPSGRGFDLTFIASAHGWNDPAGVLIFQCGWAIHDRQTALFGKLPRLRIRNPDNRTIEFFEEMDAQWMGGDTEAVPTPTGLGPEEAF